MMVIDLIILLSNGSKKFFPDGPIMCSGVWEESPKRILVIAQIYVDLLVLIARIVRVAGR